MGTLNHIRVLRIGSRVAAAYCSKLLRGFGATVQAMATPGFEPALHSPEEMLWFEIEQGRLDFDWQVPEAADVLHRLLESVDLLIDARAVEASDPFGLAAAALAQRHPRLITCRISSFGLSGPYQHYQAEDITLYAMSGLMHSTGHGQREPLNARPRICELSGGLNAYAASLMALLRRGRDGIGDFIDLSVHESALENYETAIADHLHSGAVPRRNGDEHGMVPWRTYPCADGEVAIVGGPVRNWVGAIEQFDVPELLQPRFADVEQRLVNRKAFEALLRPWLASKAKKQLFLLGQERGLAWSPLASVCEVLADPQHEARDFFQDAQLPDGRKCRIPGAPFRSQVSRWRNAGMHEQAVPVPVPVPAHGTEQPVAAPLQGLRILDFSHDWAGPHAARVMADFGAEVIKVEYPGRVDSMRGGYKQKINGFPRFWQLHRGKKSLTLDLKRPDHYEFCRRLVAATDLVLENSRPGVMQRLGLAYDTLRDIKPDIIMLSMSAFGATGPYAAYAGYGGTIEAISGMQALTAYDRGGPRYRIREMDVLNGIFGLCAALTALFHRQSTTVGQWIDLSETETSCWLIGEYIAMASSSGTEPLLVGNRHAFYAPQGCYPCSGKDRWVTICITSNAQWRKLAGIIGGKELEQDGRYATVSGRSTRHDEIDALIGTWTCRQDCRSAMRILQAEGIAAGAVFNAQDLSQDEHLAARDWLQTVDAVRLPGFPFRFRRGGSAVCTKGPDLGQHNDSIRALYGDLNTDDLLLPQNLGTAYEI
ncbi:CoA transferase [Algiphilus sp. W345]|uniref:CoA transferase n=1 Tax=Banduia mediterranea TaxID=3075609 RepID=A0ABU2WDF1_9GAMM|nr:CoA transferase [Algiphilus sp. W345]MDT0495870.1 CoA transferase [Algiphilus sp. W345]